MNDVKGEVMSHKSILWVALLVVIAALGLSVALAGASMRSGSHNAASWVSGSSPEDASWVDGPGGAAANQT